MVDKRLIEIDKRFKENWIQRASNRVLVLFLTLISKLPFWIIYGISDFIYVLLRFVVQYRKKVILQNLKNSFPEKTDKERKQIAGKFYRYFCDFAFETVKLHGMSEEQMSNRVSVTGMDLLNAHASQGRSTIVLSMHYNNWEWGSYLQSQAQHQILMVYNSIRGNAALEKFILQSREKCGGKSIPMHRIVNALMQYLRDGKPALLWLAADQTPPPNTAFWTTFLNQETPFFTGPAKLGIKTNQPILFNYLKKTGRGKYEVIIEPLIDEPKKRSAEEILLIYSKRMEEIIREKPEYYLWSHRRWKHKRPEGTSLTV